MQTARGCSRLTYRRTVCVKWSMLLSEGYCPCLAYARVQYAAIGVTICKLHVIMHACIYHLYLTTDGTARSYSQLLCMLASSWVMPWG